jgi:hypothetical protein
MWVANQNGFIAYDASNLANPALYSNSKLGTLAHFNTPSIANGKVYVGANLSLQILGLLGNLQSTGGDGQAISSLGTLPIPLQVSATNPYTGVAVSGVTVSFTDGGKGGSFNPASAVTNSSGMASTSYTAPKTAGTITISASYPTSTITTFTVTVLPGAATKIQVISGNKQTAPVQTTYALPLVMQLSMSTATVSPEEPSLSPMAIRVARSLQHPLSLVRTAEYRPPTPPQPRAVL